ncbi:hypothetical protein [Methanocella conradii]|uniref:hypothetical protein n=1 Tax=Methanocella conradii TaxID=1175444 RepID=UPI00157D290B|nr:hypothetical protein [Methanocella conradii]
MKTKVHSYEGIDIYRVDVRGETFYRTDPVFGEPLNGKSVDEVAKKVAAKLAKGDTRVKVQEHEGVSIYQVKDESRTYYISDLVNGEPIIGDTIYEVALGVTRRHAMLGY